MTYLLLTLFFASLIAIVVMMARKLSVLKHEEIGTEEEVLFELPFLSRIKNVTLEGAKKQGYNLLVGTVRFYVKSANFAKNKYSEIRTKIMDIHLESEESGKKKEISKFLKTVGDYKRRIREIKHKVSKEENLQE